MSSAAQRQRDELAVQREELELRQAELATESEILAQEREQIELQRLELEASSEVAVESQKQRLATLEGEVKYMEEELKKMEKLRVSAYQSASEANERVKQLTQELELARKQAADAAATAATAAAAAAPAPANEEGPSLETLKRERDEAMASYQQLVRQCDILKAEKDYLLQEASKPDAAESENARVSRLQRIMLQTMAARKETEERLKAVENELRALKAK